MAVGKRIERGPMKIEMDVPSVVRSKLWCGAKAEQNVVLFSISLFSTTAVVIESN